MVSCVEDGNVMTVLVKLKREIDIGMVYSFFRNLPCL